MVTDNCKTGLCPSFHAILQDLKTGRIAFLDRQRTTLTLIAEDKGQ